MDFLSFTVANITDGTRRSHRTMPRVVRGELCIPCNLGNASFCNVCFVDGIEVEAFFVLINRVRLLMKDSPVAIERDLAREF